MTVQDLMDFIPRTSPDLTSPWHLEPFAEMLVRSLSDRVRGLSSTATRHGKTTLIGHWIAWALRVNPKRQFWYYTMTAEFAYEQNRKFRDIFLCAGGQIKKDLNTIKHWETPEGGGVIACSRNQKPMGRGAHILVIDDPYGSDTEGLDPVMRREIDDDIVWMATRIHPGGSQIINLSRIHPEDAIGVRMGRPGWDYVCLPAIVNAGTQDERPLWPERWSMEDLRLLRGELSERDPTERVWWSQFMGSPLPEGGNFFKNPARYESLPVYGGFKNVIGIDLSFSTGKKSDFFACVVARVYGDEIYILNIIRTKGNISEIEGVLRDSMSIYGQGQVYTYASGPEIGTVQYLISRGIPVQRMHARHNKLVRAQKTLDRWTAGKIRFPIAAPWLGAFLSRASCFRGSETDEDDEIDALVSMHDGCIGSGTSTPRTTGRARM